jgi:hypothetical protein
VRCEKTLTVDHPLKLPEEPPTKPVPRRTRRNFARVLDSVRDVLPCVLDCWAVEHEQTELSCRNSTNTHPADSNGDGKVSAAEQIAYDLNHPKTQAEGSSLDVAAFAAAPR